MDAKPSKKDSITSLVDMGGVQSDDAACLGSRELRRDPARPLSLATEAVSVPRVRGLK